jgi:DNA-binding MarR family transcriptional regulator
LVVIEASEHDGRTYLFSLSASGKATFTKAAAAWRNAQAEFEGKFGHARAKALRAELFGLTAD